MKSSDIISIVIVAMIGVLGSYFAVNALMGNPDDAYVSYKTIEVISPDLAVPDSEVFNADAINPTVEVEIDSCEDTNGNGILDPDEQRRCLGQEEESEEGEGETSDGATN